MTVSKMGRSFRYAGLVLPDPARDIDIEGARALYSANYPEITTVAIRKGRGQSEGNAVKQDFPFVRLLKYV